jgi:hypothetical protein
LFAAFLSAFLILTVTQLQANSTDISKDILLHISLQLSNSSFPPYVEPQFIVPSNVAAVNTLLFASLAIVLLDAYLAMLIKGWLRDFDRSWRTLNVPEARARTREMRMQGLERWKLSWVVALLPLLIQASLVLFGFALLILLFDLHRPTAYSTLVIFAAGVCFYFCTSVVSALDTNAPFTSPLSRALEVLLRWCRQLLRWCRQLLRWCRRFLRFSGLLLRRFLRLYRTVLLPVSNIIAGLLRHRNPVRLVLGLIVAVAVVVAVVVVVVASVVVVVVNCVVVGVVGVAVVVAVAVVVGVVSVLIYTTYYFCHSIWRLFFRDVSDEDTADAMVKFHPVEGAEIHCAISKRLFSATFKAVENFPIFMELFDQWVHTPSLRPLSVSDWHEVLPLIQPYLSNTSLSNDFDPLPVARLLLCSDSDKFPNERKVIIASLGRGSGGTTESPSIEQMYIHLLRPPESDWSLAGQVVRKLNTDRGTIVELRWILNWITLRYVVQNKEFPNNPDLPWVSNIRNIIIPFLRSTAVYIIQNRLVNDDHRLFDLLLLITRAVADASKEAQFIQNQKHERWFLAIGNSVVSSQRRWDFIHDLYLYAASSTSAAGFKREFAQLVILLLIATLSTVDDSGIDLQAPFINTEKDLAVLMDALWETWQAPRIDHHLLTGIAVWLLRRDSGLVHKPLPNAQQGTFQDLLNAYDSCTKVATPSMNSNTLRFIKAALSFSLETGKAADGDSTWEPQTLELSNPWLVMHIHNILEHDWRIPGSAMREAAHGQLEWLEQAKGVKWYKDDRHEALDELDRLDARDALDALDVLDELEWREWREWLEWRERLERGELREWLELREGPERVEWREWRKRLEVRKRPEEPEWLEVPEWLRRRALQEGLLEAPEWLQRRLGELEERQWLEGDEWLEWHELLEWRKRLERGEGREWRELHEGREWDELRERLGLHEWREFCENCEELPVRSGPFVGWPEKIKNWDWYDVLLRTRRRDVLERCVWRKRRAQQSPAALEIVARSRLNLYDAKVLHPDPVALSLFLSQPNKDISNDSRRFILQFFGSTPNMPSLLPPDATEQEAVDPATAHNLCSDFFDSKAVGDVTKWRLLTSVVFPEWKTLSTLWKDLLATEVMKMDWKEECRVDWKTECRVDWMARVTPKLAGTFNLYDFGLSENNPTYGHLSPTHLLMVAAVVDYLGAEGLTYEKARGLEEFLGQHSNILCDRDALGRIWMVLTQVMQPDPLESLVVLFGDQT